jgi:hypothetical protein
VTALLRCSNLYGIISPDAHGVKKLKFDEESEGTESRSISFLPSKE